jgi:hypothetical protein
MEGLEATIRASIRAIILEQAATARGIYLATGSLAAAESAVETVGREDWPGVIQPYWRRVMRIFGELFFQDLTGTLQPGRSILPTSFSLIGRANPFETVLPTATFFSIFSMSVEEFIIAETATYIQDVDNTTKAGVRRAVETGMAEGMNTAGIAARIYDFVGGPAGEIAAFRSDRIARTETGMAANYACFSGAESTGLRMTKMWNAVNDMRTRKTHAAANGQRVGMKEYFLVGGAHLMYPQDPSPTVPARERINCRCVLNYEVDQSEFTKKGWF